MDIFRCFNALFAAESGDSSIRGKSNIDSLEAAILTRRIGFGIGLGVLGRSFIADFNFVGSM